MHKILVLHGPNLNLLGQREPAVYGKETLDQINKRLTQTAAQSSITLECLQSNNESTLIDRIHATLNDSTDFLIFNPGAFTHTSIALRDAILGVNLPFIEVHLSNIHQREPFRHHSYFSDIAEGVILGLGSKGYDLALTAAITHKQTT